MKNKKGIIIFRENGFTLIEVMIAIVLLGIVGLAVISGIGTAFRANQVADKHTTAMAIAQRQLESIEQEEYDDTLDDNGDGDTTDPTDDGIGVYNAITPDSGYSLVSYNADDSATTVEIIGYPWNTATGEPSGTENGIQRIKIAVYQGAEKALELEIYKANTIP